VSNPRTLLQKIWDAHVVAGRHEKNLNSTIIFSIFCPATGDQHDN
jgi:hypothetical protein